MHFYCWIKIKGGPSFCIYLEALKIIVEKHKFGNKVDGGRKSYTQDEFREFVKQLPINSNDLDPKIVDLVTKPIK